MAAAAVGDDTSSPPDSFTEIREVASQWIDLVRSDNVRESFELTTKSGGFGGTNELPDLWNKDELRVQRSLGNDSVAMVITNSVRDNSGRDRAMAFRLVRRDDVWLIDASDWADPEDIDERLRGFQSHGDIRWHVTESDILGKWLVPWFVRDEYIFLGDGTLKNTYRTTETIGSWQLRGDRFRWTIGENSATEPLVWPRVVWVSEELFQVRWPDGNLLVFVRRPKDDEDGGEVVSPYDSAKSVEEDE
jgi:hypothetical protein